MGIKNLMQLISDEAPDAIRETEIKHMFGRRVAMDASMSLYSFMIAVRPDSQYTLTDESGEATSHLQGMFWRTIRMMRNGMRPIWVFDGKPPQLKSEELAKRQAKKKEATAAEEEAAEVGDKVAVAKAVKRKVRVTKQHNEEAKKLLRLMGVPVVDAPTEAEAQCAELVKGGKAWAVGTEDMDALTFGTPILLRYLTYAESRKKPVREIDLSKVLSDMGLTMAQFIDLCILMGCDYCGTIPKIGKGRAFDLIKEYGSLEKIVGKIDQKKYPLPPDFDYVAVRQLFLKPDVTPAKDVEVEWKEPDLDGLIQFMCVEKGFSEERIRAGVKRIIESKEKTVQNRLTSYFGAVQKKASPSKKKNEKTKKKRKRFTGK